MMDPILTPWIVYGLANIGIYGALAETIASVTTFVIVAGIASGLYLLTAPTLPKPEDGKVPVQATVPPRNFAYGTARLAGALMLKETNEGGGTLGTVQALVSHHVEAFTKIYLNDDPCTFPGSAVYPSDPDGEFVNVQTDGRYGNNSVMIAVRFGATPETRMSMFTTFGFDLTRWPLTARGDYVAQIGMICRDQGADTQQQRFPYGAPNPTAVCDTERVYDPRDPDQDHADYSTWTFSRNPALCIIHFLCDCEFGFRYIYEDAILPVVDLWKHAANVCDENIDVFIGGAGINRYELGGQATTDNNPKEVLQTMLLACDGWLCRRGDGTCVLTVGKFEPDGTTITNDQILGFAYQRGIPDEDAVNRLGIHLNSKDHDYTDVECDAWNDEPDQENRGHVRETTLDLKWVQDYRQARRLGLREFKRLREPLRGSLELRLSAINAAYTRWIYIQSEIPALNNRYIENRLCRFELAGSPPKIHMEFLAHPEDLEDWDGTVDADDDGISDYEGAKPPPVLHGNNVALPTPANLVVTKETVGGLNVLKFEWEQEDLSGLGSVDHDIRHRLFGATGGFFEERHNETPTVVVGSSPVRWYIYSNEVPDGGLDFEGNVRVRKSRSVGDWSNIDDTAS